MKYSLLLLIPILFFTGCSDKTWVGFYYPDNQNKKIRTVEKNLSSLSECKTWGESQKATRSDDEGSFECGLGCRYSDEWREFTCDEVIK